MIRIVNNNAKKNKNNARSNYSFDELRDGLTLMSLHEGERESINLEVGEKIIQYYFCLKGSIEFSFHKGAYTIPLAQGEIYFFYNPSQNLFPSIHLSKNTEAIFLFCSLEKIHELFLKDLDELEFLKSENVNRKFYKKSEISSNVMLVLNQILAIKDQDQMALVFKYAKALELLSLYFSMQVQEGHASCPYINDEESVRKIKMAKDILVKELSKPPTTAVLAQRVGLNEFRLKEGFRGLYGTTLFNYLLDYKMNKSRILLDSGKYKIKDLAYTLGYSNPSHFITAFKNKFGITPKKYLQKK